MVILPPLSEDRSIQILQLLTPLNTGISNMFDLVIFRPWLYRIIQSPYIFFFSMDSEIGNK